MSTQEPVCDCGHVWLDHHGVDPADGCLGVSHLLPQCPCDLTATEALRAAQVAPTLFELAPTP